MRRSSCVLIILSVLLAGCFSGRHSRGDSIKIQGAGSTFINPLMQKWVHEFGALEPSIKIDYQSIGSGGAIKQVKERTIQFGATDVAMSDEDLRSAPGELLHIPVILGAVVLTYNLESVKENLRFSPETIADIFLGKISRWDDERIRADNPYVEFPPVELTVVHRSDGSGTSAVFTNYLAKVSPEWKEKVGEGTSPAWPVGLGGKGNEGVTGQVKQTPNTIGYVELAYAVKNKLPVAQIRNSAGNFITPDFRTVSNAAAESVDIAPADLRFTITNAKGADAYPISSYVFVLIYKDQQQRNLGDALVDFLVWSLNDGQKNAQPLLYAPLPAEMVRRSTAKLAEVNFQGESLLASHSGEGK
ncbi:MAG TPA: phosphate ABC transporter substrate-binding protein PstS [Pyrinomonadaceae bacterium]|nr:phosphate ABC transporter substrate-binding protein PstS [Pyrinomonadaceae bacterium]